VYTDLINEKIPVYASEVSMTKKCQLGYGDGKLHQTEIPVRQGLHSPLLVVDVILLIFFMNC
jgi:hypothetical protein